MNIQNRFKCIKVLDITLPKWKCELNFKASCTREYTETTSTKIGFSKFSLSHDSSTREVNSSNSDYHLLLEFDGQHSHTRFYGIMDTQTGTINFFISKQKMEELVDTMLQQIKSLDLKNVTNLLVNNERFFIM